MQDGYRNFQKSSDFSLVVFIKFLRFPYYQYNTLFFNYDASSYSTFIYHLEDNKHKNYAILFYCWLKYRMLVDETISLAMRKSVFIYRQMSLILELFYEIPWFFQIDKLIFPRFSICQNLPLCHVSVLQIYF